MHSFGCEQLSETRQLSYSRTYTLGAGSPFARPRGGPQPASCSYRGVHCHESSNQPVEPKKYLRANGGRDGK